MDTQHATRVIELVTMLCEAFGRTASRATFMAYQIGLNDLDFESIEIAATRALRESRFMPSPAELRELAGEPTKQDRASLAWGCVLRNLHLGPYSHVNFRDDRITNATIRSLGGWPTFISRFSSADEEKWVRKDFLDTYRSLHRSNVNGEMCRALAGLSGSGNTTLPDGSEYVPKIKQIITGLPALPAPNLPARPRALHKVNPSVPRVELRRVPE